MAPKKGNKKQYPDFLDDNFVSGTTASFKEFEEAARRLKKRIREL
ncbi:hypothetical protein LCGC14_1380690 [marine sediment metagenome]|uniref:Uncharacterized protein n=1 Tax=marine sediment metagenome TaxID=412755 RepID=A0A0F9N4H2_9ZZZZ